jgi:hypothetical protein
MAHIQCVSPALKEARIRAHHNLVERLWNKLGHTAARVVIYREMTVESLRGIEAPLDCRDEWQRALDELTDSDLAGPEAVAADMLRKRPDGIALHWGEKTVLILEFTRGYDWRASWHDDIDQVKTGRYTPLLDKLSHCLGQGWTVEIVTLGVRGSYHEPAWRAALERFGL